MISAELVDLEAGCPERLAPRLERRSPAEMEMGVVLPGVADAPVDLDVVRGAREVGRQRD